MKIILGDLTAKVERESIFKPTIGQLRLHEKTNENGVRLIDFAATRNMLISGTSFDSIKFIWALGDIRMELLENVYHYSKT